LIELYQDERFSAPRGRNVIETETMVKHAGALRPLMIERLPGDTYRFWPKGAEAAAVTLSVASMYERACILEGQRKLREKRAGKAK
jgi:hypothetical protein